MRFTFRDGRVLGTAVQSFRTSHIEPCPGETLVLCSVFGPGQRALPIRPKRINDSIRDAAAGARLSAKLRSSPVLLTSGYPHSGAPTGRRRCSADLVRGSPSRTTRRTVIPGQSALQRLRHLGVASISYGGRAERIGFAEALARAAAVPIGRDPLWPDRRRRCPLTTGANRNSSPGHAHMLVLSVDDDTRCRIAAVPEGEAHLASFTGYDPTDFWFFPDRRRALDSVAFVDADVLECHEAMLGRRLSDESGVGVTITLQGSRRRLGNGFSPLLPRPAR